MRKKLDAIIATRIDKRVYSVTKEKTSVFLQQSLCRFNSILPATNFTLDSLPSIYEEIVIRGVKILYMEDLWGVVFGSTSESNLSSEVITMLNHMEQAYLHEVPMIKRGEFEE